MLVLFIGITTPLVVMRHKRLAKVKRAKKYFEDKQNEVNSPC